MTTNIYIYKTINLSTILTCCSVNDLRKLLSKMREASFLELKLFGKADDGHFSHSKYLKLFGKCLGSSEKEIFLMISI